MKIQRVLRSPKPYIYELKQCVRVRSIEPYCCVICKTNSQYHWTIASIYNGEDIPTLPLDLNRAPYHIPFLEEHLEI